MCTVVLTELIGRRGGMRVCRRGNDRGWSLTRNSVGVVTGGREQAGTWSAADLAKASARSLPGRPEWPLHQRKSWGGMVGKGVRRL